MNETPLVQALQRCSLHSLLMITSKALTRAGFGDVQILDRRKSGQKSRHGGHELQCETTLGLLPVTVIVKVIQDKVRVRMMDELAGAVDRTGSDLGVIVTPFGVTAKASRQRDCYRRSRIEVLDGPSLAELLLKHRIGVRARGEVDYEFFGSIEDVSERLLSFIERNRR